MIKFWDQYYIPDNMGLCIISNINIPKQRDIINSIFGKIKYKNPLNQFKLDKPIFNNFGKTYQIIPVIDTQLIKYVWETPININYTKNKLFVIFGLLISNTTNNTLVNYLKIHGYISYIGTNHSINEGIFIITVVLTKLGIKHMDIIEGCLKYTIDYILKLNWEKIINYYKKTSEINFNYGSKKDSLDLAIMLSNNLHLVPLNEIYLCDYLIYKIEKNPIEHIKPFLSKYFKILVLDSKIKKILVDSNYGTQFGLIDHNNYSKNIFKLDINLHNPFLDVKPLFIKKLTCDKPILLDKNIWYGGCSKFSEPLIYGALIFSNIKFYKNIKNYILTILSIRCINFFLAQELYNISDLQFSFTISPYSLYNSIVLNYSCLNDPVKFNQFIILTLKLIKNTIIPSKIIISKINELKEDYKNISKENPWEYFSYYFSYICQSNEYNEYEMLKELDNITINEIVHYTQNLLNDSSIAMLFFGNFNKEHYPKKDLFNKYIHNKPTNFPSIKVPNKINIKHPNLEENNNFVSYVYPVGPFDPYIYIHGFITCLILEQPFYNELRTIKQLGYLVNLSTLNIGNNYFIYQRIQSEKKCDIVLHEIDIFNKNIISIIKKIDIDTYITTAKNYLEEKENSLGEFYSKFISEIINKQYIFNKKKILLQKLNLITKNSILTFIKEFILENKNKCTVKINGH
jgi:secreted Zn-dependent insulinase-like peptidase